MRLLCNEVIIACQGIAQALETAVEHTPTWDVRTKPECEFLEPFLHNLEMMRTFFLDGVKRNC